MFDHRVFSPEYTEQTDWVELTEIQSDSSDVSHRPFQGEIDHFVECLRTGRTSHCNLADAALTHEVIFAMQRCYETGTPCPTADNR